MEVTEVKVFPVDEDMLRAYVTITLDHCFVIRDLKIVKRSTGYFVSMPSKKRSDGTYKDIAHPINSETQDNSTRSLWPGFYLRDLNCCVH